MKKQFRLKQFSKIFFVCVQVFVCRHSCVFLLCLGPDFRKLSQLSELLQGSGVSLSPRLLQSCPPSVQQEEFQAAVDALQTRGRYSQARQVALLAGLPVHRLLLSQVDSTATSQSNSFFVHINIQT